MPVSSMTSAFFCALLFACRQTPAILSSSSHHPQVILSSSSHHPPVVLSSCPLHDIGTGPYTCSRTQQILSSLTNDNFICVKYSIFYFIIHFLKLSPSFRAVFFAIFAIGQGRGP